MKILLIAVIIGIVFIAGCVGQSGAPAGPKISVLSAPSSVLSDDMFNISWEITGVSGNISHTAVHYDIASHSGTFGTEVTPQGSGYASLTAEFANGEFTVPRAFTAGIQAPSTSGKFYYRAHAIINGSNYWTSESSITVTTPRTELSASGPGPTKMIISPTRENEVKGVITLTATEVPTWTKSVIIVFTSGEAAPIAILTDGSSGWKYILDTTKYPSGLYTVSMLPNDKETITQGGSGGGPPQAYASTQVVVKN